jgi:hypothetical protein
MEGKGKRLRRSAGEMYGVIERWHESGQSQQTYCATQGLSVAVFQYWLRQWRDSHQESVAGEFVEVKPGVNTPGLLIEYPNGVKVHLAAGYSHVELASLLKIHLG